jgi:hypothetical protein
MFASRSGFRAPILGASGSANRRFAVAGVFAAHRGGGAAAGRVVVEDRYKCSLMEWRQSRLTGERLRSFADAMRKLSAIAFTVTIAASALLYLAHDGAIRFGAADPNLPSDVCTSSYFGNQCGDKDVNSIMAASSDRAFSGRGLEAIVVFAGVQADAASGKMAIVGRRGGSDVVCLTRNADLIRAAEFELNRGERALLSGTIDRRSGRTLYLTECAYWRRG